MSPAGDARGASDRRLRQVSVALRNYLRRHYRLLSNEHDDLIQQTLADLVQAQPAAEGMPEGELTALAYTILKRRLVDRFRLAARDIVDTVEPSALPEPHDEGTFDARMHYRRLLRAVLILVSDLDPAQQALLLEETMPGTGGGTRSPAQRQQLRRLRELLRRRLLDEFGITIDDTSLGG